MAAWYVSRHVRLMIVVILVLGKFSGIQMEAINDVSGKEAGSPFQKITVYDVSAVMRDHQTYPNQTEILPDILFNKKINTSALYYFKINDTPYRETCGDKKYYHCTVPGINGLSIIFTDKVSREDLLERRNFHLANTTIVNLLDTKNSLIDSVTIVLKETYGCAVIEQVSRYLINDVKINKIQRLTKIGIEYSSDLVNECSQKRFPLLEYLDHIVLGIRVDSRSSIISYGIFQEMALSAMAKNTVLVRKFNKNCTIYFRLETEKKFRQPNEKHCDRCNQLVAKFWYALFKQHAGNEIFILRPISTNVHIEGSNSIFRDRVTQNFNVHLEIDRTIIQDLKPLACERQHALKVMLSSSRNIFIRIESDDLESLNVLLASCDNGSNQLAKINFTINLTKNGESRLEDVVEKMVQMLGNNSVGTKIQRLYMDNRFMETDTTQLSASVSNAVNLLQTKSIDAGCIASVDANDILYRNTFKIINQTVTECGELFNLSNEIILSFEIEPTKYPFYFLENFHNVKQTFEKLYPGKMLTPDILIGTSEWVDYSTFYCEPAVQQINKYFQMAWSFANIYGWPKIMFSSTTMWSFAKTNEEINPATTSFSALFRTNTAPSEDQELPMTHPCIHRTLNENASQSHINFMKSQYSGATFQVNLRPTSLLSTAELETSLELVLAKFPFVELTGVGRDNLKPVESVILANFSNSRQISNKTVPLIYIEVPLVDARGLQDEILGFMANNKHGGVHLSQWESVHGNQWDFWKEFQSSSTRNFGLTVQNCSREINSKLATLKSLPLMSQVGYVICNVTPVIPSNLNVKWMNLYLGSLLYTKSYMEHFLSPPNESGNKIEVMFRLNFICSIEVDGMKNFLKFINDVNQHGEGYKIRYFIVNAFETDMSSTKNCSNSWWRLDSYADLTNISTYVNREDEFAGRQAQIPYEPTQTQHVENSNVVYIIIFVPIVTFLLLTMLGLWIYHQRTKTRLLSEREVRQFYNGGEQSNLTTDNYLNFGNMKFPKHYEIPRKDIQIEEVIGSGQFGMVHRGILSKRIEVAIKAPRTDCDKEQFKSTLSELKILCHIGQHLNIVSFLGACTKDIANGNLHIIIEYCHNGCLLKHLRENRATGSISLFELNGFSHQIASGMEYVAEKRVIHGDLAARNVLLTTEFTCKIADFGLSRRLYEMNEYVKTSQEPLPWRWMAPESLRDMEFTTKSDVWSYGVTLWEIFSFGAVPYPGLSWTVNFVPELENGMRMEKAPHATDNIHDKTLVCWNGNPDARPTFTQLKEFFVALRNEEYMKLDRA